MQIKIVKTDRDWLEAIGRAAGGVSAEEVVATLIEHAVDGMRRPGSWERPWLRHVFPGDLDAVLERDPNVSWRMRIRDAAADAREGRDDDPAEGGEERQRANEDAAASEPDGDGDDDDAKTPELVTLMRRLLRELADGGIGDDALLEAVRYHDAHRDSVVVMQLAGVVGHDGPWDVLKAVIAECCTDEGLTAATALRLEQLVREWSR